MARKQAEPVSVRTAYVTIRRGLEAEEYEAWQYYSVFFALIWLGADRFEAKEGASWAVRARGGATREVPCAAWPPITMEITERRSSNAMHEE